MFHFLGLLKAMSVPFIYMIVFGFISGFLPNMDLDLMIVLLFFPTYILIGILAPIYNKKHLILLVLSEVCHLVF